MATGRAVWGIDVGNYSLKALRCVLAEDGRTIVANAFDRIKHADSIHEADANERDGLIRDTLSRFVARNKVRGDLVAVSVPGKAGLTRLVKLPPGDAKNLSDVILLEARQQIPFPLEEAIWDHQILPGATPAAGPATDAEMGLFAIKRETVKHTIQPFFDARIVPEIVQLAPLCIYNLAVYELLGNVADAASVGSSKPTDAGGVGNRGAEALMVLAMGVDTSDVLITQGTRPWLRTIPLGGTHFTRALMKELQLDYMKAQRFKHKAAKEENTKAVLQALRPVFNDFTTEVQRAVGYFQNSYREIPLARFVLLGNPARMVGLSALLGKTLNLAPVEVRAYRRLTGEAVAEPLFQKNVLTFGVAYGLCLQGLAQAQLSTNLLPPEYLSGRKRKSEPASPAKGLVPQVLGSVSNLISGVFRRGK